MSSQLEAIYPDLFTGCNANKCEKPWKSHIFGYLLITFIIVTVLVWFVLFALQPSCIMYEDEYHKHPQVDQGKVLLIAIVLGIIITFILYMLLLR